MDLNKKEIYIFDNDILHIEAVKYIKNIALKSVKKTGIFNIALSGGSTPAILYKYLATEMKNTFPWNNTHIFMVDERVVPINHKDRNYVMIKETILDNILIDKENIHNMPEDLTNHKESALQYEKELKKHFENKLPDFDLIILGIGEDGHTASLFPENKKDLNEKTRWVFEVYAKNGKPPGHRLTLSLPLINNSKNVLFFVTGVNKKSIVYDVLINKDKNLPSTMIMAKDKKIWFLDISAATLIHEKNIDLNDL